MDTMNRISAACEILNLVTDYARLCVLYNVPNPEMSGLAETCTLVRQHLEKLKDEENSEQTDTM